MRPKPTPPPPGEGEEEVGGSGRREIGTFEDRRKRYVARDNDDWEFIFKSFLDAVN